MDILPDPSATNSNIPENGSELLSTSTVTTSSSLVGPAVTSAANSFAENMETETVGSSSTHSPVNLVVNPPVESPMDFLVTTSGAVVHSSPMLVENPTSALKTNAPTKETDSIVPMEVFATTICSADTVPSQEIINSSASAEVTAVVTRSQTVQSTVIKAVPELHDLSTNDATAHSPKLNVSKLSELPSKTSSESEQLPSPGSASSGSRSRKSSQSSKSSKAASPSSSPKSRKSRPPPPVKDEVLVRVVDLHAF